MNSRERVLAALDHQEPDRVPICFSGHRSSGIAAMKPYSTFINTSRGAVIRENEMIDVLRQRPDVWAVLDVTYPEPPPPDSPLYTLPNVVLTPHIAGPMDDECRRMGRLILEELQRYLDGKLMKWEITKENFPQFA